MKAPPSPAALRRLEEAAEWIVRLKQSPDDEESAASFMAWCAADQENLYTYESVLEIWEVGAVPKDQDLHWPPYRHKVAPSSKPSTQRWLPRMAAAAAIIAVSTGAWLLSGPNRAAAPPSMATLSTPIGMRSNNQLEDGSSIALSGNTRVLRSYTPDRRSLVLEAGEAYFEVAHDPERPFVVQAGPISVRALGTAFNIRRADQRIVVTVTEGQVEIAVKDKQRQHVAVRAGHALSYDVEAGEISREPVDPARAIAWREGTLSYLGEPLIDVVADLNRYTSHRIRVGDRAAAQRQITGTFSASQVDSWVTSLPVAHPLLVTETPDGTLITAAPQLLDAAPGH